MKMWIFSLLIPLTLAGCQSATSPLVDWNSRIGNYSYELALQDLGLPVRSTKLNDGSVIADWRIARSKTGSPDMADAESSGGYVIPALWDNPIPLGSSPQPNKYLRLSFGPDQKLTGWKKYTQYFKPGTS